MKHPDQLRQKVLKQIADLEAMLEEFPFIVFSNIDRFEKLVSTINSVSGGMMRGMLELEHIEYEEKEEREIAGDCD